MGRSFVGCWESAAGQVFVDCQAFVDFQAPVDCRKLACSRSPVRNRAFVDCRELVDCRACLSLAIAFLVEVLRIHHRLYLECGSVVDGMPTTGNSSQDNLTIEMSGFQLYRFRAALVQ